MVAATEVRQKERTVADIKKKWSDHKPQEKKE